MNCPNCGREIKLDDASFCPYCSKSLRFMKKRSGFPIASGVLVIIGSVFALLPALASLIVVSYSFPSNYSNYDYIFYGYLIEGLFGIIGFSYGLASGILTLKRRSFSSVIVGISTLLAASILYMTIGYNTSFQIFAIPIFVLSILGIIFCGVSKSEFS